MPIVEEDVIVVKLRLSCNLHDLTLEQVVGKMSTAHSDMLSSMRSQLQLAGAPPAALAPLDAMAPRTCARSLCVLMRLVLGPHWSRVECV